MSKGTRYIDGQEFILCGRELSKENAQKVRKVLLERWAKVRIIKLADWDFMLYVHGRMAGE